MTPKIIVPPFDPRIKKEIKFFWWSWHPAYPYWSKSCWGGDTIDEALKKIDTDYCSSMHYYHNKLIREGDGTHTEVVDLPCKRLDLWDKFIERENEKEN